jgi:hypothetical protein
MRPAVFVALTLVLASVSPVHAQLDSKQASAQFKPLAKARVAEAKAQFAEHQGMSLDAIEAYEAGLAAGDFVAEDLVALFDTLNSHVGEVSAALFASCKDLADDASDLLAQVTDAEVVAGTPPEAFAAGLGSTFDDTRDKLASLAEKSLVTVFKRLNKTVKALDKLGVNLVVVHRPLPASNLAFVPKAEGTGSIPQPMNMTLDFAFAFSRSDTDDDGVVCIAGQASPLLGDVVAGAGAGEGSATLGDNQRWSFVATALVEGNTFITVGPFTGGMQDTGVIAIR